MRKWSCGCQIVRVGTKEFHAQCTRCRNLFECMEPEEEQDESADEPVEEAAGESTDAPTPAPKGWEQTEIPWPLSESEGEAPSQDVRGAF